MTYAHTLDRRRGRAGSHRLITAGLITIATLLVCGPVAYMVWPAPTPVALDAPSLPITIGGVTFNAPPAAIRVKMQRRPGTQSRIDLMYLWPSLQPPDPAVRPTPSEVPSVIERIFVTVATADNTLPPTERLQVIYPRYVGQALGADTDGLTKLSFRDGTPYQGEDLIYDASAPGRFLLRCTRNSTKTPGMCLHERRLQGADITVRFPRDWLNDWRPVMAGIDTLIASLRPSAR